MDKNGNAGYNEYLNSNQYIIDSINNHNKPQKESNKSNWCKPKCDLKPIDIEIIETPDKPLTEVRKRGILSGLQNGWPL